MRTAARHSIVVEMLLKLLTVSPQPPSAFWCSTSQRNPTAIRASKEPYADVFFCTIDSALTATAVDRADVDSSPTQ